MRIELTRVGLLVYLANHYTTRGAQSHLKTGQATTVHVPRTLPHLTYSLDLATSKFHFLGFMKEGMKQAIGATVLQ